MNEILNLKPFHIVFVIRGARAFRMEGTIIASSLLVARQRAIDDVARCGMEWNSLYIDWPHA